jgi:hypothetical protein
MVRVRIGVLTFALAVGGCGEKEAAPVTAARAFAAAMQRGDVKTVLPMLEQSALERLEQEAARASDHVGGRRNIEPYEMLQIVGVPDSFQVAKAELVTGDDESAQVRLVAADGKEHLLDLVVQEDKWRVRVPQPPITAGTGT